MFIQTEDHAQPGVAEVPARPHRARHRHGRVPRPPTRPGARRSPSGCSRVDGVGGVFLGSDFITVTKTDGEWQHLKPAVLGAIMEHFLSGMPVLRDRAPSETAGDDEFFSEDDAETVATIKELIETRVRPAVAQDGGDITFRASATASSISTCAAPAPAARPRPRRSKHGIENLLRHFVPEVREIQEVAA